MNKRKRIIWLERRLEKLEGAIITSKDSKEVFTAIGFPQVGSSRKIGLLIEAKKRGYFDSTKCFKSHGKVEQGDGLYIHKLSSSRLDYEIFNNSLHIPSSGLNQKHLMGQIEILRDGKWTEVLDIDKLK